MTLFSIYHIMYLLICTLICVGFYFIFRNKSQKVKYIATFIPLVLAFIIHFLKLLIPHYRNQLPSSIMSITFETICATSTLIFPFIYLSKSKILKDYMVVIGVISGFFTLLLPLDASRVYQPFELEVIRFFFAHLVIFLSPLFTYIFNIHRPNKKWVKHTLLTLLAVLLIVTINNITFTFLLEGKDAGIQYLNDIGFIQ